MKKIYLLLFGICLIAFNVNAQKWVSTSPQNKNAVLEEFTGIHCGYCPDGHRRANELQAANPGRVVLINIHSGNYANPTGTEPDFRTTEGTAIDAYAKPPGYPCGIMNRATCSSLGVTLMLNSTTQMTMDRGQWAPAADAILSQPSPVNIAVKAHMDFSTRTLTTEVEVYYTSNAAETSNKLTVELLQDTILGYQSDYGNFNPNFWYNGQYEHMHAFRKMLSTGGAFGEKLDTTTAGHYTYRKYITVLPTSIKNIEVYLYNLRVVAFVAATNADIYTGAEANVELNPNEITDLSLIDKTVHPAGLIFTSIHPQIEVTNNMDQTVTSFDVSATINGTKNTKSFTGSLTKGQKTTIDWGGDQQITVNGSYTIPITGFENINGGTLNDISFKNNAVNSSGIGFTHNAFSTLNAGFDGTIPPNIALNTNTTTHFQMYSNTSPKYGANNTTGAVFFYLDASWNVAGKEEEIVLGEADFSSVTKPLLSLYYAYSDGSKGGTAPVIKILVSEDGGINWSWINTINPVQTGQPTNPASIYLPASNEYQWIGTDLSSYKNKSVILKITVVPGTGGNGLWIDEIAVSQGNGIADQSISNDFTVYPNPVKNDAKINFSLNRTSDVSFELYNSLGQKLMTTETTRFKTGNQSIVINTTTLEQGTYIGVLKIDGQSIKTKIVK